MTQMTHNQLAGHFAAKYNDPEKYDDLFQEAWVAILECKEKNLSDKDMYWHVKSHVSLYYTYRDRTVPLPPRSGNKEMADHQETENDIQDYVARTEDATEALEVASEVKHLKRNISKLPPDEQSVLHDIYWLGKGYRDLARDRGHNKDWWQKYHTALISKLNLRQLSK